MLNIAIIAARVVVVGCIATIGYSYGRIHGFNHATDLFNENIKSVTTELVSGWIIQGQRELTELEEQLHNPDLTALDKLTIQSAIDGKKNHIAKLNDILTR